MRTVRLELAILLYGKSTVVELKTPRKFRSWLWKNQNLTENKTQGEDNIRQSPALSFVIINHSHLIFS
jgi:hypothetical protein